MRDIRPLEPENKEFNAPKLTPPKRNDPALQLPPAAKVPVSAIHVAPERDVPWSGPTQALVHDARNHSQVKRPMFYNRKIGSEKKFHLGRRERSWMLIFVALIIAALGLAGFLFLPTATIGLTLRGAPLLVTQDITITSAAAEGSAQMMGAAFVREVEVEGQSDVVTTEVVGTKAKGVVQLVNRTVDEQKIKEQSRLVTKEGTLFYMQKHAIVPPQSSIAI
jgi:hypothetical protein